MLDAIRFDPARDRIWLTGDLVNRGPESAQCLRFVMSLGEAAVTVLGNHDLHLVCVAAGVQKRRKRDTLDDVIEAPDGEELVEWLRTRPLMHAEDGHALVHAGLLPEWTVAQALGLAREVERALRASNHRELLGRMYGDEPDRWDEALAGIDRLRVVINAMTRLRVCDSAGAMVLGFKGVPGEAKKEEWTPWFDMPRRRSRDHAIVCGHWSALGVVVRPDLLSLDSGCVWGRALTAVRLGDRKLYAVACPQAPGREG